MKTKNSSPARNVVLAALFLALAFVLPMVTGHLPQVGNMLCPMHFPILLCGFVLGGPWGLAVGFAAPLLRSVLFGMPPMFPIAISMAFELAGLSGSSFPFSAFLSGALFTAVPGIIAQLVLIPLIITALQKARLMD